MPYLLVTPNEAQLLNSVLKDEQWKYLLLRIGNILITQQSRIVEVTEEELWALRGYINLTDMIGDEKTGWNLLMKIYALLIDITRGTLHNFIETYTDIIEIPVNGGVIDGKELTRYAGSPSESCPCKNSS